MTRASVGPRVVVVSRRTEYEELLARHGTRGQVRFFLEGRGLSLDVVDDRHHKMERARRTVSQAIPLEWRRTQVLRDDLSRFLFEPQDLVVAVGQDGLVANVAKYLSGQPVIGINPDRKTYDGILVRHSPRAARKLLRDTAEGRARIEERTMVEVRVDDGQRLIALNEIFLGHVSHQSARYRIRWGTREERHSSSGIIVATGTGATGWALSICRQQNKEDLLPAPTEPCLVFLVREPFPSITTGTKLTEGRIEGDTRFEVISELNEGGVLFGDGIEADRLEFRWGLRAQVGIAPQKLRLVISR